MTAPAAILLAHGADDPRVVRMAAALGTQMQRLRPNLRVLVAFDDDDARSGLEVAQRLARVQATEAVLVPLDICRAVTPDPGAESVRDRLRAAHPGIRFTLSRPVGPATELLPILDERLRTALRASRTVELDGLVLSLPSNGDVRGHALISRRARQWSGHHKLPCTIAVADGSGATITHAIATLRGQGRRHIAVGSLFLSDSADFTTQSEHALAAGAVAVSSPIGADDRLLDLVMARFAYAAMDMLDPEDDEDEDATSHAEITELVAATQE